MAIPGGQVVTLQKSGIRHTRALPESLMPAGLLAPLSEAEIEDLITYLLTTLPRC